VTCIILYYGLKRSKLKIPHISFMETINIFIATTAEMQQPAFDATNWK
jgi:hypothetical protein